MTQPLLLSAVLAFGATSVAAQPTQTGVAGKTDDPVYSVRVEASDGVTYKCKPKIKNVNGQPVRECLRDGAEGTVFAAGTGVGIGLAPAIIGGVVAIGAIASDSDGGTSTTTSTGN